MKVTVDRISDLGNGDPIAIEQIRNKDIHVLAGEPHETYDVELYWARGFYIGVIDSLTDTEKREYLDQHKKEYNLSNDEVTKLNSPPEGEQISRYRTGPKYGSFPKKKNRNHLLNGKL